jgi:integrase
VIRSLGRAWVEADGAGGWRRRRGKPPDGVLTEAQAATLMLELVGAHHAEQTQLEQDAEEQRRRGVTFRELAREWIVYLEREKGAKPSTVVDYGWMLAEPGQPHRRGTGTCPGLLMEALGDRRAAEVTTRDVADFLRKLDQTGFKPRTVNRHRQLISAVFNYGMRADAYGLIANPAGGTTKRREPPPAVLDFYEPDEVEQLAAAASAGAHRRAPTTNIGDAELAARHGEDLQDAQLYRIAAYTGLRLGELLALRWEDIHLDNRRLIVHRALSAGVEGPTKSWQARFIPLSDGAASAFAQLATRVDFTGPSDLVFCNRLGRPLSGAALRIRFKKATAAAGLRALRFHALRHGAGSMAARQADPRWIQGFLGHSKLATTERYLHAKARPEDVARLNRAFALQPAAATGGTRTSQLGPAARPVAIPADLDSRVVPKASGKVELPLHIRWTGGSQIYDLDDRADRARVYEQVLREGTEDDVLHYVEPSALIDLWDELVLPPSVRDAWADWIQRHGARE